MTARFLLSRWRCVRCDMVLEQDEKPGKCPGCGRARWAHEVTPAPRPFAPGGSLDLLERELLAATRQAQALGHLPATHADRVQAARKLSDVTGRMVQEIKRLRVERDQLSQAKTV